MKQPLFAVALAAAMTLAGVALAQPGGGGARAACQADIQKLCPNARPGPGGGMRECVTSNWGHLSDPCKTAITQMRAMRQNGAGKPGQ